MTTPQPAFYTLGVLGGMGPAATADLLTRIVESTPACRDQDHLPVLVRCIPQIPDRTDALLGRGPSPAAKLAQGARELRRAGAQVLAIACNTAHHWYPEIRDAFGAQVLHVADAVTEALRSRGGGTRVGLLATSGTLVSGFYQQRLQAAGYEVLVPAPGDQVQCVDRAIREAKSGRWDAARRPARAAAQALIARGAQQVVLGCTELPLALARSPLSPRLLDANQALAEACVRAAIAADTVMAEAVA